MERREQDLEEQDQCWDQELDGSGMERREQDLEEQDRCWDRELDGSGLGSDFQERSRKLD